MATWRSKGPSCGGTGKGIKCRSGQPRPVTWRKLERLGFPPIRETMADGKVSGRFYRIPLNRFRWGLKRAGSAAPGRRGGSPGWPVRQAIAAPSSPGPLSP